MDIHGRIQELINLKGISLYELSERTGIHKTTVYNWYNDNHYTPNRKSIELICAALDVSITEFYSGIDEGELDGEQMLFLELFAKVPKSKRKVVFEILRNLSDEK
ncbi:MAG: helix-turn-helix transcriptional regulator [Clostridia bacterium]|jgi:transcriptional regulator with XRE-family HTH domain|nr:helix-turn-helix transcriptional regulator [Clostridia bacterium]